MSAPVFSPDAIVDYSRLARHGHGVSFLNSTGLTGTIAYSTLDQLARVAAAGYLSQGLHAGDRIVLTMSTSEDYLIAVTGALLAGLVPCTVAPPTAPSDPTSAGMRHLTAAVASVRPAAVVAANPAGAAAMQAALTPPVLAVDALQHHAATPLALLPQPGPDDLHHIQLTSGSTSAPRAAALTHRAVAVHLAALVSACDISVDRDKISTWLPLHHDMGFVQVLVALSNGIKLDLMPPLSFLRDPLVWLRHIAGRGGTISAAPPFAYRMAADRQVASKEELSLSGVRRLFVGAEPIPLSTLRRFRDTFAPSGLADDALVPCYGMAETVLATTLALAPRDSDSQESFGRVTAAHLDREALHQRQRATPARDRSQAVTVVNCGRPIPGLEIDLRDGEHACGAGEIGEIRIRGSSVMAGYLDATGQPTPLHDGWHSTGDLGFRQDGDLYVVGRTKEMLVIRGRNLPPYDVEAAIEPHPAIGDGRAVVFSHLTDDGDERVVAVVETRDRAATHPQLRSDVATAVRQAFGFNLAEVVVLRRGRLPRTTSGKRQRELLRQRYLGGELS